MNGFYWRAFSCFINLATPSHPLQGGFQKGLGCLMTSFMLRVYIFCERRAKSIWPCLARWAVFYKLYNIGIDKAILVYLSNGCKSGWFSILQGTRKEGFIYPFLYLVLLSDLLYEIEASGLGMCFNNIDLCCPTVADGMLIQSYSKAGLDSLIHICLNYSYTWRFLHSAAKSAVVVFKWKTFWLYFYTKILEARWW